MLSTPLKELLTLVTGENRKMMERVGGLDEWSQLAPEVQDELAKEVFHRC